jgi:nicotinic acid mononucleotide adenylyltransferase
MQYRQFGSLYVGTLTNEALLSAPDTGPHLSWISETLFQQRKRMSLCAGRKTDARKHSAEQCEIARKSPERRIETMQHRSQPSTKEKDLYPSPYKPDIRITD